MASMETVKVEWTGTRPLMMHSERLANPRDPIAQEMAKLTSRANKEKKTLANIERLSRLEWEGGMYFDSELGPVIPAWNIQACITEGARLSKQGKAIERGVLIEEDNCAVIYSGPRDLEKMWAAGHRFVDTRSVGVNGSRVMRTRPIFRDWKIGFTVVFDASLIERATLLDVMRDAGRLIGLGEFNQRFGRFEVTKPE